MNRGMLAGLLALQVLVVGGVFAWNLREPDRPGAFFDFDPDAITGVQVITDEHTMNVLKVEDAWQLADGKPADGTKVTDVLNKLASVSSGWPIATSASTAERFEVTEAKFQKHLTLTVDDDVVADAYFGTSPSYRRVHVSDADGGPVYAIEFSNYELGTDNASWLDKNLLRPEGAMQKLTHEGEYTLTYADDTWTPADGSDFDSEEVDKVVRRFENLTVFKISEAELPEAPTATLGWTDDAGDATLSLYHFEDGDEWVATSDRVAGKYGISTYIAKDMAMTKEDLLVKEQDEADDEPADATPPVE